MDRKSGGVTISIMRARLNSKLAAVLCLLALICQASAIRLGSAAKAYTAFASIASGAVESGELKIDTTLREIDEFLSVNRVGTYPHIAKAILDGPTVLALREPRRVGSTMLIGFTEETDISKDKASSLSETELGRYVFFWDQRFLRANLYWKQDFDELVKRRGINVSDVDKFDFPELAKLAKLGPPVSGGGTPPPFPKSEPISPSKAPDVVPEPRASEASLPASAPPTDDDHGEDSEKGSSNSIVIGVILTACILGALWMVKLFSRRGGAGS
jgi:hypothetical protein